MEASSNQYIITTDHLKIHIEGKGTIDYGTMNISYGRTVLIEGPNGSGKSTLLNILTGRGKDYLTIENGNVFIYGKELSSYNDSDLKRKVVYIDQEEVFLNRESAFHYLKRSANAAVSCFKNKKELQKKIEDMIYSYYTEYLYTFFTEKNRKKANTLDFRNNPNKDLRFKYCKKANDLSGGQRKMLHLLSGIIKAKVANCKLILMDEPLNNLDKENKRFLIKALDDLRKTNPDITILLITHCRIFPGIKDIIQITKEENESKAIYCSFDTEMPKYNCLGEN